MVERRVVPVEDLAAAIAEREAAGYRLTTISPADDPRWADMDGPDAVRLDRTADDAGTITVEPAPLTIPELAPELVVSRAADADHGEGRAGMRYRDLIPSRLGGRFIASHIAIPGGGRVPDYVHFHDIRFQLIFCHAGWVEVVYEDQGDPFVLRPGDCVIQPPEIRHRVLALGSDSSCSRWVSCSAGQPISTTSGSSPDASTRWRISGGWITQSPGRITNGSPWSS